MRKKFGRIVPEICTRTDTNRQTHRHAYLNTPLPLPERSKMVSFHYMFLYLRKDQACTNDTMSLSLKNLTNFSNRFINFIFFFTFHYMLHVRLSYVFIKVLTYLLCKPNLYRIDGNVRCVGRCRSDIWWAMSCVQ